MEKWLIVPSDPRYEVSDTGRVRNAKTKRLRTLFITRKGYLTIGVGRDGKIATVSVHRMVCEAFHGPAPEGKRVVCHWDGDPQNNTPENLRWGTQADNMADMLRHHGIAPRPKPTRARDKLSDEQVRAIRHAPRSYGMARRLAEQYGVSLQYIYTLRSLTSLRPHVS